MKREYKIILIAFAIVLAYCIGIWIPFEFLKTSIREEQIGKTEYYRLIISIISAFITFTAVLVAMFKDDLREYWKYARINFSIPDNNTIEITNDVPPRFPDWHENKFDIVVKGNKLKFSQNKPLQD